MRPELRHQFEHVAMPDSDVNDKEPTQPFHVDDPNKPKSKMIAVGDDSESSAADNMKSLIQECGVSPHKMSELLQELPPQRVSDVLLDYYFTTLYVRLIWYAALLMTNSHLVEIGPVILSLNKIFAPPICLSAAMEEVESGQQISTMFVSSLCCSLFWQYQSGWLLNILLVILAPEGSLPSAITGLVSLRSYTSSSYTYSL